MLLRGAGEKAAVLEVVVLVLGELAAAVFLQQAFVFCLELLEFCLLFALGLVYLFV